MGARGWQAGEGREGGRASQRQDLRKHGREARQKDVIRKDGISTAALRSGRFPTLLKKLLMVIAEPQPPPELCDGEEKEDEKETDDNDNDNNDDDEGEGCRGR